MNLSGKAVSYWMQKEKIELSNLFVVVDDLALPFGTIRLRGKGSDGGHNGLKSINQLLGTQDYARLRFGIGNEFPKGKQVDYGVGRVVFGGRGTFSSHVEALWGGDREFYFYRGR